jgi:hypothetical protein
LKFIDQEPVEKRCHTFGRPGKKALNAAMIQ